MDLKTSSPTRPRSLEIYIIYVDLDDNTKCVVEGSVSIKLLMDLGGIMDVETNLLSILAMEERGLEVNFMGSEVVVAPKGTDSSRR